MKKRFFLSYCLFQISYSLFSQNIGIGTTTPVRAKLELYGASGYTSGIFGGESSGISLQRNWPGIGFNEYFSTSSKYISNGYAAKLFLDPNSGFLGIDMFGNGAADANTFSGVRALTIANNGNMGIKTGPANVSMYVIKGTNFDGAAVFGGTNYNSHFYYSVTEDTYIRGGKNGSKVIINDINGGKILIGNGASYVGINNGIPVYPLEVRQVAGKGIVLVEPANTFNNWEIRAERYAGVSGWSELNLIYNGQYKGYFHPGPGSYLVYSDKRLKTCIENMSPILHQFMQLQPVAYEMKFNNTNHETTMGFIAQDVKTLFPELVAIVTDTSRGYPGINDLHGLNYNGFTVLTIKVLQEQHQLIKKMQLQNKELARRIAIAEAQVTANLNRTN